LSLGNITSRESGLTSCWYLITRKSDKPTEETKQMTALMSWCGFPLHSALASEVYREGRVAKLYRVLQRAF
jgi:hypothetical protein